MLLGGALLYTFNFNAIYLLSGKTYSLSSVYSADELVITIAAYSGIALLLAWLAIMFGLRIFRKPPAEAAQTSMLLIFVTLYLLTLPALWNYYRNGSLITWTLPEFGSMFLGFLSIGQGLFVAAIGLLLTGVAAMTAKILENKSRSM